MDYSSLASTITMEYQHVRHLMALVLALVIKPIWKDFLGKLSGLFFLIISQSGYRHHEPLVLCQEPLHFRPFEINMGLVRLRQVWYVDWQYQCREFRSQFCEWTLGQVFFDCCHLSKLRGNHTSLENSIIYIRKCHPCYLALRHSLIMMLIKRFQPNHKCPF